jgi:hypothetical protein
MLSSKYVNFLAFNSPEAHPKNFFKKKFNKNQFMRLYLNDFFDVEDLDVAHIYFRTIPHTSNFV